MQSGIIHVFAGFYLLVMTIGWFMGRMTNPDYFAQSALILTSIGLYHAQPPGKKQG